MSRGRGMKTVYRISSLVFILLSCLVVASFYVATTRSIEQVYLEDTHEAIHQVKRNFISDTVNNLIRRIEEKRSTELERYRKGIVAAERLFMNLEENSTPQRFKEDFKTFFSQRVNSGQWDAFLWNTRDGQVYYDSLGLQQGAQELSALIKRELPRYALYRMHTFEPYQAFFGVRQEVIDTTVKKQIADEIHASKFSEDSYIWVNEVVNYDGGDNYAIRRIHPNLTNTEGMFLSTNMTDIAGNLPYLEELTGVKRNGELFFTYNFKKMNSDVISEKLTYAKLYKPFDWIIAMGIHLDDMAQLGMAANKRSSDVAARNLPWLVSVLVFLVAGGSGAVILIEKLKVRREQKALESDANHDALTRTFNRRLGMNELARDFSRFKRYGVPHPAIIVFDIDDFKLINDTFGHTVGDKALQVLSETIGSAVRSTDRLYRWGGDEFVLVCDGIDLTQVEQFATKLLDTVRTLARTRADCHFGHLTISMGISYFHEKDESHLTVLERSDQALYKAKRSGKDRFEVQL